MAGVMDPLGDSSQHQCPICSKQFNRRDLKERHRRRCEKSIGKQRPTKKTACESCIASKVKCDHKKPACSRCLSRSMQCEYKLDPQPAVRIPVSRTKPAMSTTIPEPSAMGTDGVNNLFLELMDPIPESDYVFQPQGQMPHDLQLSPQRAHLWDQGPNGAVWHTTTQQSHFSVPFALADATSLEPNWPALPTLLPDELQQQHNTSHPCRTESITTNSSHNDFTRDRPQYSHNQSPTSNDMFNSQNVSVASSESGNNPSPLSLSQRSSPPLDARPSSSLSEPLLLGYRSKSVARHSDSLSEVARAALSSHKPLPPGTISVETAIKMITEYPMRMLVDTFQSPFVHPKLNRDSPRGMPEPIAVALACVGMKMHAERSGLPFVCNIFRDQREKLIKALPTMSDKHEDIAAALHAMCIYQIEGLLSENRYDSKLSPAVLHQEYLVRMTRRLVDKLEMEVPEFFLPPTANSISWEIWTVHESLRRILFLLMIIHQLLGATKILEPAFFEPIFSDRVSERLLLPCDERLWQANSQAEWDEVKRMLGDNGYVQLGEAIRSLRVATEDAASPMSGIGIDRMDSLRTFEQLPEVTKLLVSVAQIPVKEL